MYKFGTKGPCIPSFRKETSMRILNLVSALVASVFALALGAGDSSASNVKFGKWQKDPNRDRYYCQYEYPAKNNPTQINIQICIWYPHDAQRKGYYYFANKNNQIWGRCVCPASPDYNPNVMQWSKLMNNQWQNLTPGDCPAPKDGDPNGAAIDKIPDPPV
jgi:hypothetical protein